MFCKHHQTFSFFLYYSLRKKKIRYCCIPYDEILSSTYEYVRKISHWRAPKVTRKTFLWLLLHVNQWINQEKRRIFIWRLSEMKPGPNDFAWKLQISNCLGWGLRRNPHPQENHGSAHFETKVANETTHNLGVADQKILSDSIFDPFL